MPYWFVLVQDTPLGNSVMRQVIAGVFADIRPSAVRITGVRVRYLPPRQLQQQQQQQQATRARERALRLRQPQQRHLQSSGGGDSGGEVGVGDGVEVQFTISSASEQAIIDAASKYRLCHICFSK
jgi:hypothetical protein